MSRTFFPIAEFESRHDKVRAAMDDLGIDLLLVQAPSHVNYLIGTPAKGYQEFQVLFFPREPGPLTLLTRLCEVPLLRPNRWPRTSGVGADASPKIRSWP